MNFEPSPGEKYIFFNEEYVIQPHPQAPYMAFGQDGRKAGVFQVKRVKDNRCFALKIFKPAYHETRILANTKELAAFQTLDGMRVCERRCITKADHPNYIKQYPIMEYAILMPWIMGSTWYDIICERTAFNKDQAITLATKTSKVLTGLESDGIAHCDISNGNVVLDISLGQEVQLIDVEDLFKSGLPAPSKLPAGTDGYAHRTSKKGQWNVYGDRFAGAILLSELASWHEPIVRKQAKEGTYFDQADLQNGKNTQFQTMVACLERMDKRLRDLFIQAWESKTLEECPTLGSWHEALERVLHPSVVTAWEPIPIPKIASSLPKFSQIKNDSNDYSSVTKWEPIVITTANAPNNFLSDKPPYLEITSKNIDTITLTIMGGGKADSFEIEEANNSDFTSPRLIAQTPNRIVTISRANNENLYYRVRINCGAITGDWSKPVTI